MNGTERAYGLILRAKQQAGLIAAYRYEAITIRLANRTTYTPDFVVLDPDGYIELHEVKGGFTRDDARVKFKVAAEQYSEFRFVWCQYVRKAWTITPVMP